MNILLIETATNVCSVALTADGTTLALRECTDANAHSTRLPIFIDELLKLARPDAVCVSAGPGSYTGLRIGVSTAKGICYALNIPLLSVPTPLSMAALHYHNHPDYNGLVCPMIDARRMECYTMLVAPDLTILRNTAADIITDGLFDQYLSDHQIAFIGDGAAKTKTILASHPNATYPDFTISALGMANLASQHLAANQTEDVAYFEPFYLKDFIAKKSIVHGLR